MMHFIRTFSIMRAQGVRLTRESNRLKHRSGSGSGSRNYIFNGSVPVQVQDFSKIWVQVPVRVQLHQNLKVQIRFGFTSKSLIWPKTKLGSYIIKITKYKLHAIIN